MEIRYAIKLSAVARRPVGTVTMHEGVRVELLKVVSNTYKIISIIYDKILCGAKKGGMGQ